MKKGHRQRQSKTGKDEDDNISLFSSEKYEKLSQSLQSIAEGDNKSQWSSDITFHSDKKKKTKKRSTNSSKSLFSRITLNRDPTCAKYMPYNEVSYPKLEAKPKFEQSDAQLDSMWMVGFMDNHQRTKDKQVASEIRHYLQMPGTPAVNPRIKRLLNEYSEERGAAEINVTPRNPNKDPSSYADMEIFRGSKGKSKVKVRSGLSKEENYRLQQLEKEFSDARRGIVRKKKTKEQLGMAAYMAENKKIQKMKKKKDVGKLRHHQMQNKNEDLLVQIQRLHTAAATMIQAAWRRYQARCLLLEMIRRHLAATKIQAAARGMIGRKLVAQWWHKRNEMIKHWQCRVRRALSNKHWRRQCALEYAMAVRIQRALRGFLGRVRWWRTKLTRAALLIQRVWRGVCGRAVADRIWLGKTVTVLQNLARKSSAMRTVKQRRIEMNESASIIGRCYLGFRSRRIRNEMLFERETSNRHDAICLLTAEYEQARDYSFLVQQKMTRLKLGKRLDAATAVLNQKYEEVSHLEGEYYELMLSRESISPRGIEQGWDKELDKNIVEFREKVTEAKLDCIFNLSIKPREIEEEIVKRELAIKEAVDHADALEVWREEEVQAMFERLARRRFDTAERRKHQAIGDERRQWQVKWHIPSGKPDKRRRPGRPWDPSVLAGPETHVYCAGQTDILAGCDPEMESKLRWLPEGGEERIGHHLTKLQMQTHLNQVQHYDQMLKPVGHILQKNGFAPFLQPMEYYGPPVRDDDDPPIPQMHSLPGTQNPTFGPGSALETGSAPKKTPHRRLYKHEHSPAVKKLREATALARDVERMRMAGRALPPIPQEEEETDAPETSPPSPLLLEAAPNQRQLVPSGQNLQDRDLVLAKGSSKVQTAGNIIKPIKDKKTEQALVRKESQDSTSSSSRKAEYKAKNAPRREPREDDRIQWEVFDKVEAERYRFEAAKALRKAFRKF